MQTAVLIPQCAVSSTLDTDAKGEQWHCTAVTPSQHAAQQALNNTPDTATRSVGVVYDAVMELHLRQEHLEHPNRVRELNRQLQVDGLLERCCKLAPKSASDEELLLCHSREHIARVEQLYMEPVNTDGNPAEKEGDTYIISGDIYCNQYTSKAARSAAGCAAQAVRAVLSGEVDSAFAVVRPPGHHAESNELMGFCFYNNVAVAAHVALQHREVQKVVIVDWDIHHGNGTQEIFYKDKQVLFVSIHRRDAGFYPEGCGYAAETGADEGAGYTVNIPWDSKGMGDADYLAAYDLVLDPIIQQFDPQLVLISAGFDAADGDTLGKCHVTPAGFAAMTQRLQRHAGGKVVAVLEGGYVPWLVGACASAVMKVLLGEAPPLMANKKSFKLHKTTQKVLTAVTDIQREYWSHLAALEPIEVRYAEYATAIKLQSLSLARGASPPLLSLQAAAAARSTRATTRAAAGQAAAVQAAAAQTAGQGKQKGSSDAAVAAQAADITFMINNMTLAEQSTPTQIQPPPVAEPEAAQPQSAGKRKVKTPKQGGKGKKDAAAATPPPNANSAAADAVLTDGVTAAAATATTASAAAAVSSVDFEVPPSTAPAEDTAGQFAAVLDGVSKLRMQSETPQTPAVVSTADEGQAGDIVTSPVSLAYEAIAPQSQEPTAAPAAAAPPPPTKTTKIRIKKSGKKQPAAAAEQSPVTFASAAPVASGSAIDVSTTAGLGKARRINIKKVPVRGSQAAVSPVAESSKPAGQTPMTAAAEAVAHDISSPAIGMIISVEANPSTPSENVPLPAKMQLQLETSLKPQDVQRADGTTAQVPEIACEDFYSIPANPVPVTSPELSQEAAASATTAAAATGKVFDRCSGAAGGHHTAELSLPVGQPQDTNCPAAPIDAAPIEVQHAAVESPDVDSRISSKVQATTASGSRQAKAASSPGHGQVLHAVPAAAQQQPAPSPADNEASGAAQECVNLEMTSSPAVADAATAAAAAAGDQTAGSPDSKGPTFGQWFLRLVRSSPPRAALQHNQPSQEVLEAANMALPDDE